ncbi:hypothetical protein ALP75_203961 [Pseudomonas syringae pv. actinidiae]|nr:hypothetical protein ALP75_203961 [Pseudomonas syringae pv. actinidiae]
MQHAITLDKHFARPVDQNFRDRTVAQQHFQWPEAGQLINQFFGQPLHFVTRDGQSQASDVLSHFIDDKLRQSRS